jgi:hypothetical protein
MRAMLIAAVISIVMTGDAFATGDDAAMAAAANGFYSVYKTFHPSDGVPSAADRAKYAPFLSPGLEKLLTDAESAEARFAKANKDSPPLIEGDLFTSMFEGATSVQVAACSGDDKSGHCAVKLEYAEAGDKPTDWTDTIYLVRTERGWQVDDIAYGGSWAFGNKGRLSETLKQTISFQ